MDKALYKVKYWPTWSGLFIFYLFSKLPYSVAMKFAARLAVIIFKNTRKHKIIKRNIELCFPEKTAMQQQQLVQEALQSLGQSFYELGFSWWASDRNFRKRTRVEGLENLTQALARNKGVIIIGGHFHALEVAGRIMAYHIECAIMRQVIKNPVVDAFCLKKNKKYHQPFAVSSRQMIRHLKNKKNIVYFPDLNNKKGRKKFIPFFNISASTNTAICMFANYRGTPVIPVTCYRDNGFYILKYSPMLEAFPSGSIENDMMRINKIIENDIRKHPEQYMWHLKRFKTRPEGEKDVYQQHEESVCL